MSSPDSRSCVYFVQSGKDGPIKIGTTKDMKKRLADLRLYNSNKLKVLATIPGDRQEEQQFHKRFSAHRIHGEWFNPHRDVLLFIFNVNNPLPKNKKPTMEERIFAEQNDLRVGPSLKLLARK